MTRMPPGTTYKDLSVLRTNYETFMGHNPISQASPLQLKDWLRAWEVAAPAPAGRTRAERSAHRELRKHNLLIEDAMLILTGRFE
jgi:hypothetical protein